MISEQCGVSAAVLVVGHSRPEDWDLVNELLGNEDDNQPAQCAHDASPSSEELGETGCTRDPVSGCSSGSMTAALEIARPAAPEQPHSKKPSTGSRPNLILPTTPDMPLSEGTGFVTPSGSERAILHSFTPTCGDVKRLTHKSVHLLPVKLGNAACWQIESSVMASKSEPPAAHLQLLDIHKIEAEAHIRTRRTRKEKLCSTVGCHKLARSRGFCMRHGGGRRCSVNGCMKGSQSGGKCISHGGGKRCTVDGCHNAQQSDGLCISHGGGKRCYVEGCEKSSQRRGLCHVHGGGQKCSIDDCTKGAQRSGLCVEHGGRRYCRESGCLKTARGGGFCIAHGGDSRCCIPECTKIARENSFCSFHLTPLTTIGFC